MANAAMRSTLPLFIVGGIYRFQAICGAVVVRRASLTAIRLNRKNDPFGHQSAKQATNNDGTDHPIE